jgi:hypothetical protein
MRQVRTIAEIREGEKVGMLFTPRLYMFKGEQGVTLEADTTDMMQVYSLYADIMFLAALNLWTLEGNLKDDAPFRRSDFHEYSAVNPKEFGKAMNFAIEALTGRQMKDFIAEQKNAQETGRKSAKTKGDDKKKDSFRWITRLLKRS